MTSFDQMAAELAKAAARMVPEMRDAFSDAAKETRKGWRANIRAVAPHHLPHAPSAITYETRVTMASVEAEVGAEEGRIQANLVLGNEFGSVNQPPHLSGQKAALPADAELKRRADSIIGSLLP